MKNIRIFLSENFNFWVVKFSVYLNRHVFVMCHFVCVEVLRPIQPIGVMLSMVSLPNHMFTGQVSPVRPQPALCTLFCHKLTTAPFESAEGRE